MAAQKAEVSIRRIKKVHEYTWTYYVVQELRESGRWVKVGPTYNHITSANAALGRLTIKDLEGEE